MEIEVPILFRFDVRNKKKGLESALQQIKSDGNEYSQYQNPEAELIGLSYTPVPMTLRMVLDYASKMRNQALMIIGMGEALKKLDVAHVPVKWYDGKRKTLTIDGMTLQATEDSIKALEVIRKLTGDT